MGRFSQAKNFCQVHRKPLTIVIVAVTAFLFVGSVVLSVFIGGEFAAATEDERGIKGMLRLNESSYSASYFEGERFVFDKDKSKIMLLVRDPKKEDLVRVDDLPAGEYGFRANGEGEIVDNASDIIVTKEMQTVEIVSKAYPDVTLPLEIRVFGSIDESKLASQLTYEAEEAKLYENGALLTAEEMRTKPNTDKPYVSSAGTDIKGQECSGGASLRNFGANNMKIEFEIVSTVATAVRLEIKVCKRSASSGFGKSYRFTLNGERVTTADDYLIPVGSGYFEPYSLPEVTINLVRGFNVITFESGPSVGTQSPVNFDGIGLTADAAILGGTDAIVV